MSRTAADPLVHALPAPAGGDGFRRDVHGLRALAVLAVVLYHAGVPALGGGYVGVDVFLVISGFLITTHLLRTLRGTGRVRLGEFYARRARRILPASFVVLGATLAVACLALPPARLREVAVDAAATALYVPNVLFAVQGTDYLAETDPPSLLQHYWSLGLEEQFYLVWPVLLVGLFALRRSTRVVGALMGVVVLASFACSVVLTSVSQPWAFFLLPSRAWEFAVGGLVAVLVLERRLLPRAVAPFVGWSGLVGVVGAVLLLDDATAFPGWAAAVPVLGTAAVILAGTTPTARGPVALLGSGGAVFLGEISYSLYLVHWPAMTMPAAILGLESVPVGSQLLVAVACVGLAWLLRRYVELPFLRAPRIRGARASRVGLAALGATAVVLAAGAATYVVAVRAPQSSGQVVQAGELVPLPAGTDVVPANLRPSLVSAGDDLPVVYSDGYQLGVEPVDPPEHCVYGTDPAAPRVVLVGDSHASQWVPALEPLVDAGTIRLEVLTKSGCPAADLAVLTGWGQAYPTCGTWRENVLERLRADPPAVVVLADYAGGSADADGARFSPEEWEQATARTLHALPESTEVVVLQDTPTPGTSPTLCLSDHLVDASVCDLDASAVLDPATAAAQRAATDSAGGTYVALGEYLCNARTCPVILGDTLVYRDGTHLTATMAARLGDVLAPHVTNLLPVTASR